MIIFMCSTYCQLYADCWDTMMIIISNNKDTYHQGRFLGDGDGNRQLMACNIICPTALKSLNIFRRKWRSIGTGCSSVVIANRSRVLLIRIVGKAKNVIFDNGKFCRLPKFLKNTGFEGIVIIRQLDTPMGPILLHTFWP